jgi:hypothetical protein
MERQNFLQRVVQSRFQQQFDPEQQARLSKADSDTLQRWLQLALDAPNFDDFLAGMN